MIATIAIRQYNIGRIAGLAATRPPEPSHGLVVIILVLKEIEP
jgi:hypothetical protein